MSNFLQTQFILKKCFNNVTNKLQANGFYHEQDYFNAIYDETKDALRISLGEEGEGLSYWKKPVQSLGDLPLTDKVGTVRFVFDESALYFFNGTSWEVLSGSGGSIVIKDEGTVITTNATEINFIGTEVKSIANGNAVTVYIPSLEFVSHYNTQDGLNNATVQNTSVSSRYVSDPTMDGNPFYVGDWYNQNNHYDVFNNDIIYYDTNDTCSLENLNTTFEVKLYNPDDTLITSCVTPVITSNLTHNQNNITVDIVDFATDTVKYKANINVSIDISAILSHGGRFTLELIHHNAGVSYVKKQENIFYDAESNSQTVSGLSVVEQTVVTNVKSGVKAYGLNSVFKVDITDVDYLNDLSFPDNFIRLSGSDYGLSTININYNDSNIHGWTKLFNNVNVTYSNNHWLINQIGTFIRSSIAKITADTIDWGVSATVNSSNNSIMVDTYNDNSSRVYEDFTSETLRLQSDLTTFWDSNASLMITDSNSGLQVGEGTYLFYPNLNYTIYNPDISNQYNYSLASGIRYYYRRMWHTGTNHSNGLFHILGVTEANLTNNDVIIQISLDGTNWYVCNDDYLGGVLNNGDGCRINPDSQMLPNLEFTLGSGQFTDNSTGGGWGVYLKIIINAGSVVKMDKIEIVNWG